MQNNSLLTLFTKLIKQEVDISNYTISKQTTNLQGSVFNAPMQIPNTVVGDGPSITTPASGYFGDFEVVDQGSTYLVSIQGGLYNGVDWTAKEFVLEKYTELGYFENTRIFYIYVDTVSKTLILKESSEINDSESTHFVLMMIVLPPNPTSIIYTYDTDPETSKFIYGYEANFLYYLLMYSVNIPSVLPEIPAGKITGNLVIEGNATITSQSESVLLTPDGMYIYDVANVMSLGMDGDYTQSLLATFNKNGLFFYDGTGTVLSKFTKDEASIAGWTISADSLSGTNIILYPEGGIQTIDFEEGIVGEVGNEEGWSQGVGWKIAASGSAYFNNVTVFGTLYSSMGNIAGWEITDDYIANGNIVLASKGEIYTANYIPEVSGWKIRYDGLAEFNNAVIRSTLYSDTGFLGNWKIANGVISSHTSTSETLTSSGLGVLTLTADAVELIYVRNIETGQLYRQDQLTFTPPRTIEGMEVDTEHVVYYITSYDGIALNSVGTISANFETEVSGWQIDYLGNAEFNAILIRNGDFMTGELGGNWTVSDDGKLQNSTDIVLDGANKTIYFNNKSTYASATTGIFIGYDSGTPKVNIGSDTAYLKWDGTDLLISGEISASTGIIGGWTIGGTSISSYGITLYASEEEEETPYIGIGKETYASNGGIWLGKDDTAWKMSIDNADGSQYLEWTGTEILIKATNFELDSSGNITITGGTIGGWTIGETTITAENIIIDSEGSLETVGYEAGVFDTDVEVETKSSDGSGEIVLTYPALAILSVVLAATEDPVEYTYVPQTKTVTNLALSTSHKITYLKDTSTAGSGWMIASDGSAFFNDVTVFGTLYSNGGNIAGWDINEGYLANGNIVLNTSGEIYTANYNHRISGWKIRYDGFAEFNNVLVRGAIESETGNIGGWLITETTLESEGETGVVMSSAGSIASKNFVIGSEGWKIFDDGTAEFNHIIIRDGSFEDGTVGGETGLEVSAGILQDPTGTLVIDSVNKKIKVGDYVELGSDVVTADYLGLKITADNYWETDGTYTKLSLGGGKLSYDDSSGIAILSITGEVKATSGYIGGTASGWVIDEDELYAGTSDTEYSVLLDSNNAIINIHRPEAISYPAVSLGMAVLAGQHGLAFYNNTTGASTNYWVWDTNAVKFKVGDATNYLDFNVGTASKLTIKTDTFDLESNALYLKSGTYPYLGMNTATYDSAGGVGIWLGSDSGTWKFRLFGSPNNYLKWDGSALDINVNAGVFRVTTAGALTASSATITGSVTATGGAIAGWTLAPATISSSSLTLTSGTSPYIGIGTTTYGSAGIWLGKDTFWKASFYADANNYLKWDGSALDINVNAGVFRVTTAGALTASSATITGSVTANTGYIGGSASGWTIAAGELKNGTDIVLSASSKQITISNGAIKLGIDVSSTNDGLYINATNYWYSTGSFKIGSAASYITGSSSGIAVESTNFTVDNSGSLMAKLGTIGGWKITDNEIYSGTSVSVYSMLLDKTSAFIGIHRESGWSSPLIKIGYNAYDGDHGLAFYESDGDIANNYWVWDNSSMRFRAGDSTNYISFNADVSSKLAIKTDTFDLQSTNFNVISGAYPYMGVYAKKFMGTGIWTGKGAEETITPDMTANTVMSAGDGTYTASNSASGSTAWYLFSSNSSYIAHAVDAWTKIALPVRKIVYEYNIYSGSVNYYPKGWRLEGSNDNTNWETIDEESAHVAWSGYLDDNLEIDNPKAFLYYRLYITEVNTPSYTSARITRLDLYDLEGYKLSVVGSGTDPNYMRFSSAEGLQVKGDFWVGAGDNAIYFEDSQLLLGDNEVVYDGDNVQRYIRIATMIDDVDTIVSGIGYFENSEDDIYQSIFSVQNRFADYDTPSEFLAIVSDGTGTSSAVTLYFCTYNDARTNKASEVFEFLRDDDTSTSGYFNTSSAIKSVIPYWYGAVGSPTTKTPAYVSWTSADNCPFSNIWVWGFTGGGGAEYHLYVRDAGGTVRHVQFS